MSQVGTLPGEVWMVIASVDGFLLTEGILLKVMVEMVLHQLRLLQALAEMVLVQRLECPVLRVEMALLPPLQLRYFLNSF